MRATGHTGAENRGGLAMTDDRTGTDESDDAVVTPECPGRYTFRGGSYRIKDHPQHWEEVKSVVKELNDILPLLLAEPLEEDVDVITSGVGEPSEVITEGDCPIHYVLKEVAADYPIPAGSIIQPGKYMIAVNAEDRHVNATFRFPALDAAQAVFTGRKVALKDNKLSEHFEPYGVRVFALKKQ